MKKNTIYILIILNQFIKSQVITFDAVLSLLHVNSAQHIFATILFGHVHKIIAISH